MEPRIITLFVGGLFAIALLGTAKGGTFEDGVSALQRQDNATAIRLLLPLAQQGNAEAQFYVAIGYNTVKDYVRGAMWYRKSADQGDVGAQYDLGGMYERGQGVPQDYVLAYLWLNLAVSNLPDDFMVKKRDEVATKMTPDQLAEAQKMAREWKPKWGRALK
jgi:hypothetical protein